jgi:hypothetical protein
MDLPTHGKRTGIVVIRKRYRCKRKECLKTFLEPLGDMDEKRMATKRLVEFIEKQSVTSSATTSTAWKRQFSLREPKCDHEPEEVVLYTNYGGGFYWPGKACRKCNMIIAGRDTDADEVFEQVSDGAPEWVPKKYLDSGQEP